jgi:ABC-type lipoprotein export system ATPase subunit
MRYSGTVVAMSDPATPAAPFIICENLVKVHKVAGLEVVALQGLDLVVNAREVLGVVGSSGSGKSTLLSILGGLDHPTAGKAIVNGRDLLKMSDAAMTLYRRSQVGFVWQQGGRNLVPYLDAQENVELPMLLEGRSRRFASRRAQELLELVGLGDRRRHRMTSMSGGEQQRVAIAIALANSAPLLLADEPTGELDSLTALSIFQALRDIRDRLGVTVVIVSHDREIAKQVDRVIGIQDGKVATETSAASGHETRAMLDSAGRLQIPKALREQFGVTTRVVLEATPEGVLMRAVADTASPSPDL